VSGGGDDDDEEEEEEEEEEEDRWGVVCESSLSLTHPPATRRVADDVSGLEAAAFVRRSKRRLSASVRMMGGWLGGGVLLFFDPWAPCGECRRGLPRSSGTAVLLKDLRMDPATSSNGDVFEDVFDDVFGVSLSYEDE